MNKRGFDDAAPLRPPASSAPLIALAALVLACGGEPSKGGPSTSTSVASGGGSGGSGGSSNTGAGGDANGDALTVTFPKVNVPAGTEQQGIVSVKLPNPETVWVNELGWTSTHVMHHGRLDAPPTGFEPFFPIYGLPVGAKAGSERLPDGYALGLVPNQELRVAYHFVNTTPSDFDAEVTVTLHVLPKGTTPPTPASLLALMNMAFSIPPQSTFELETTCPLPVDTKLLSLMPHQHDFGKGIDAWVVGGAHDGKLLYTTDEWEDPPIATFDPPLELKAGDQLRWVCRWQNLNSFPIPAGQFNGSEMCSIAGLYAPSVGPVGGGPLVEGGPCMTQVFKLP